MHEVAVTDHAIERYQERVKPGLGFREAEAELLRVIGFAAWSDERPEWLMPTYGASERSPGGYLLLGDGIAFPLARQADGVLITTTCFTRGGASEDVIESRRYRKKWRRATRHANADDRRATSRRRYEDAA